MNPITPTPVQRTWGGIQFMPSGVNPQEAEPWIKYVWARFIDHKPVLFQPKEQVSGQVALLHLKACMNTDFVAADRRLVAAAWLASKWFDSAEILEDPV